MVPKEACQGVVAAVFLGAAVAVAIAIVALGHQVEAQMLVEEKSTGLVQILLKCKNAKWALDPVIYQFQHFLKQNLIFCYSKPLRSRSRSGSMQRPRSKPVPRYYFYFIAVSSYVSCLAILQDIDYINISDYYSSSGLEWEHFLYFGTKFSISFVACFKVCPVSVLYLCRTKSRSRSRTPRHKVSTSVPCLNKTIYLLWVKLS
jgi:hypothetical protein